MIKSEFIARLTAKMTHLPEKHIAEMVNLILETMSEALAENTRIEIRGFGSFSLVERPSRSAHNPKTGQKVMTENKFAPHFKPGKELKDRVDASRTKVKLKD